MQKKENIQQHNSKRKDREARLYYALTIILAFSIFLMVLETRALPQANSFHECIHILCDGTFVSGLLLFSLWLISWGWYHGVLDIFLYSAALMLSPFQKEQDKRNKETRDFVTYREHKKLERRAPTHFLVVGSVFLSVSLVFYLLLFLI